MDNSMIAHDILSQLRKLDYKTRLYLMEKLSKQLKNTKTKNSVAPASHNLSELSGLGAEIWEDIDVDDYLRQERRWGKKMNFA